MIRPCRVLCLLYMGGVQVLLGVCGEGGCRDGGDSGQVVCWWVWPAEKNVAGALALQILPPRRSRRGAVVDAGTPASTGRTLRGLWWPVSGRDRMRALSESRDWCLMCAGDSGARSAAAATGCECDAPRCEREGCQDKPTPTANWPRRVTIEVQVDRDLLPGWGYDPQDYVALIRRQLAESIPHYNPEVRLVEAVKP